jgi:hypothetical protein
MKNSALFFAFLLLMVGCSSGTTVSDLPQNVTNRYVGTFQNTPGTQNGSIQLDLIETAGVVSGNVIFTSSGANCLRNAPVSGNSTGFNIALEAAQSATLFTITTTVTIPAETADDGTVTPARVTTTIRTSTSGTVGTTLSTASDGTTTQVATSEGVEMGTLRMQFAVSNSSNTLNGTYIVEGTTCSNQTGSGSMTLNR